MSPTGGERCQTGTTSHERAQRASHAIGASRRSGERERV